MFDDAEAVTTEGLEALVSALSRVGHEVGSTPDQVRVDQVAVLERVKAAVAAAQVRLTAAFVDSQEQVAQAWLERARECSDAGDFDGWRAAREQARAASFDDGVTGDEARTARSGRRRASGMTGVAAQVALARRESPVRGAQHVRLALALTNEMPHTLAALEVGELSEWRAQILVTETATLTTEQRSLVDAEVVGPVADSGETTCRVGGVGDRELARRVRAVACRLDAASVMARAAKAEAERRVTIRPAPDTMAYVTALLPVAQAVAAHAALTAAADTARAAGDERGKGQVMADIFVTRVTGQTTADAVPVEVQLVMTDRALLAGDATPAQVPGYGTVPAAWARDLLGSPLADELTQDPIRARVWLRRRLFSHPATGTLVAMDSNRRTFEAGLRRYVLTRDAGSCRTPWCDAPARHLDHVHDHADGGPTTDTNGQSLCVRCNHTKQLPGFTAETLRARQPGAAHAVRTTTPTGHTYTSHAPPLLPGLTAPDADPQLGTRERLAGDVLRQVERFIALTDAA
ncbi:HNH endonuclease signature motif containing protein [Terracoccus sp. 273MFTsu3.1]|uniref:HNH endonuclease n=1 Tax=Terracoccus sp. 273MFTsu3.1 TaxID=1172188 RepID=UPI000380E157|nr:HNH endonuclease signature motif containing protein [Terracoccus sp. 273MFTsu3.1]